MNVVDSIHDIAKDDDIRIPCWCEENIWRFIYYRTSTISSSSSSCPPQPLSINTLYVIWISNRIKHVPMLYQRASSSSNDICHWDYHVIALEDRRKSSHDTKHHMNDNNNDDNYYIYDLDTTLQPYPIVLQAYLQQSFPSIHQYINPNDSSKYQPMFRVVSASSYIKYFTSHRLHMYNEIKQTWNAPPPCYQCIIGQPYDHSPHPNEIFTTTSTTTTTSDVVVVQHDHSTSQHQSNHNHHPNEKEGNSNVMKIDSNFHHYLNFQESYDVNHIVFGIIVSYDQLYHETCRVLDQVMKLSDRT
jgi:N-terminal glutamine amidase